MAGSKGIPQRQTYTPDLTMARVDQARSDLAASLKLCPLLRGRLVSVSFASAGTSQAVRHDLGVPAACFVVRMNYDAAGGMQGPAFAETMPQPTGTDLRTHLWLLANAICTVDLWFYPRSSAEIITGQGQSR